MRIIYFTLGPRFRYASLGAFNHWSLLGEFALRVPLGKLEPFVLLGAGYGAIGGLPGVASFGGIDLHLGGELHYYLSDSFSVGAGGCIPLLNCLARRMAERSATFCPPSLTKM